MLLQDTFALVRRQAASFSLLSGGVWRVFPGRASRAAGPWGIRGGPQQTAPAGRMGCSSPSPAGAPETFPAAETLWDTQKKRHEKTRQLWKKKLVCFLAGSNGAFSETCVLIQQRIPFKARLSLELPFQSKLATAADQKARKKLQVKCPENLINQS